MENIPFIKSYIIIPFIFDTDEIDQSFYYNQAYAVDLERSYIIIFNLKEDKLQELKSLYPLSQVYTDTDFVPEYYTDLFRYVNAQMDVNLKRVTSPHSLRWIGAYANPDSGIIKIVSNYYLHGVDANNPPKETL